MASLLSWAKRDILAPIQRDVLRPVNNVAAPVVNTAKGLGSAAYHVATIPINEARAGIGFATHNQPATSNAQRQANIGLTTPFHLLQGTIAQGAQLGESLNPFGGNVYNRQITPTNPVQKFLLGNQPIPSMQKQYQDTKAQYGATRARSEAGFTALTDALGGRGAAKTAPKLPDLARNTAKVAKNTTHADATPANVRVPLDVRRSMNDYADHLDPTKKYTADPAETARLQKTTRAIGDKFGKTNEFVNGTRAERASAIRDFTANYETNRSSFNQAAKSSKYNEVGAGPNPARLFKAADDAPKGEDLMKEFSRLRKQHGNDADFYDKVVLNNQEAPGMIGQLSRSIAREVEGKGANITDELNDQLTPINHKLEAVQLKDSHLNDLKQTVRKLERDTGQKGLYDSLAKNMGNMNQDEQIAYLTKGLTSARDSGAMAASHIGAKPKSPTPPKGVKVIPKSKPYDMTKTPDVFKPTGTAKALPKTQGRNLEAEQAALTVLKNKGLRRDAVDLYQRATGANPKQALFSVQRAAKEAKQSMNVTERTPNPLSGKFNLPTANQGKFQTAAQNRNTVVTNIKQAENQAYAIEKKLSANDKANIGDYHEGTKDIAKADNPELVRKAIEANTQLTDTVHALGENYGSTPHIKSYFPRYLADVKPEDKMASIAQEEAALAGKPIPLEDSGNYAGFHNKSRIFKTRQEAQAAGFKMLHDNPYEDLRRYAGGAKINLGDQAFTQATRQADQNLTPGAEIGRQYPLRLRGGGTVAASGKGYRALKNYQAPEPVGLPKKALRGINTTVVKTIVANPIFHGGNQEFNAVFQGAWRLPGNKVANMAKVIKNQASITSKDVQDFYREGNFSPDYGRDRYGFIAKGLQKAGVNPAKAEISPRAMAKIEENIRVSLWKQGKDRGLNPAENTKIINKVLGDQSILGDFSSSYLLFAHYLKTNVKLLGDVGVQASKGKVAPLAGLAVGYTAYMAAQKAWEKITGNDKALVRAPGVLGVGLSLTKIPGQVKAGKIPSVVTNHLNPGIVTGIEQATNRDLKRAVIGVKGQYNSLDGKYGSGRLKSATGNLFGPARTIQSVQDDRTSPAAATLGYLTGLYNNKPVTPSKPPAPKTATGATPNDTSRATSDIKAAFDKDPTKPVFEKTSAGNYAYSTSDGVVHTAETLDKARLEARKDSFVQSGKNQQIINGQVFRMGEDGKVSVTSKVKYDYQVGTAMLSQQKASGDVNGYIATAQKQLQSIAAQLKDPSTDPLEALTLQNQANTLQDNITKYKGYGGFTKPKAAKKGPSLASSFKTARISAPKLPKITVRKTAYKPLKTRKISVSKIPYTKTRRA